MLLKDAGDQNMVYIYYQTHGSGSDTLWNINDSLRIRYYGVQYVPTTWCDGVDSVVGSSGNAKTDSAKFAGWYTSRRAAPSPLQMTLSGTFNPTNRQGRAKVTITATDSIGPASLRIRYLLLENLPYMWTNGVDTVWGIDHVQRAMMPDPDGVPLTISNGQTVPDSQSFTMQNVLNPDSTEIAVFVQSDSTREILEGVWADVAGFTGVQGNPAEVTPVSWSLAPPSPSPLTGMTRITFGLPRKCDATLKVFNLLGQEVRTLAAGPRKAGLQVVSWDARDGIGKPVPGGVYFFRLEAQGRSLTRRAVVLR